MISISLTKFLDFTAQTGEPKVTSAFNAHKQSNQPYDPAKDYHRRVRTELVRFEKTGEEIDWAAFIAGQNPKKQKNYEASIDAYFSWRAKLNQPKWVEPQRATWTAPSFVVRVNPELGLEIEGIKYNVKIYLNKAKLSRLKSKVGCLLMAQAFGEDSTRRHAILDVRAGQFHIHSKPTEKLNYLLLGEAAHMSAILDAIKS